MIPNEGDNKTGETPLQSWKEIGAYRSSVYAYPSELDAWRAGRAATPDQSYARSGEPTALWRGLVCVLTLVSGLVTAGDGVRPVSAQPKPIVKRLVCVDCADFRDDLSSGGKSILGTDPNGDRGDLAVWELSDSSKIVPKPLLVHDASQDPFSAIRFSVAERPFCRPTAPRSCTE